MMSNIINLEGKCGNATFFQPDVREWRIKVKGLDQQSAQLTINIAVKLDILTACFDKSEG